MSVFMECLSKGLVESEIEFTDDQLIKCNTYNELLIEWNNSMNLTAIEDPQGVAIKHFIDSLLCLKYMKIKDGDRLIDVGTGAGFPGIPIKIFSPNLKLGLLDSLTKRCRFLSAVIESLGLKDVTVIQGRAEDKGKDPVFREKFSLVTARAVTSLPVLAEYCLPLLKIGGVFFAMKGPDIKEEVEKSKTAIITMGGAIVDVKNYCLPFLGDKRSLIIIEKDRPTPVKYPRKAGIPGKQPIS